MTDNTPDRLNAVKLRLEKFELNTGDPKWSSYALDRFLEDAMSSPGGSIQDVYQILDCALKTHSVALTNEVAAFIKDVVVRCFTRYRTSYMSANWKELADTLDKEPTQAQLYLALRAIPSPFLTPQKSQAIEKGLESTPFHDEIVAALAI